MNTFCIGLLFMVCTAPPPPPPPASTFCQNTKFIYWSPSDTRKTKEQVDTHNRVRKRLCRA